MQSGKEHPWVGSQIGNLTVKGIIGKGRTAEVLLAREEPPGRDVAVKLLSEEFCPDESRVRSFIEEARNEAKLKHRNILEVYRVAVFRDRYFMVFEYASGGTVAEMLRKQGHIPLKEAVRIIREAVEGLRFASILGMIHRDIKPENLLIGGDGTIKVADFGIASRTGECAREDGLIYGSPHYISPEQAGGAGASTAGDIYSLGATFYHLLTGRTPFKEQPIRSLILCHISETPIPANRIIPTLPKRVVEVVENMMAKNPADRYQNYDQVLSELGELENVKTFDKLRLGGKRRRDG
jgi:serine/threonine protein kinase